MIPLHRFMAPAALAAGLLAGVPALAVDVGISVQIGQPGVYGRIDIGRFPHPAVVVQQPVYVHPARHARPVMPVYMWVPPGHQKDWRKHCRSYGACGVPVYFVRDDWYRQQIVARGNGRGYEWRDDRRHDRRDFRDFRDHRRDDRRAGWRDDRRGDGRDGRGPGR